MVDIEKIKNDIVECLTPLDPDKIILFGSYAYGRPTEESDIDLLLLKDNIRAEKSRDLRVDARMNLRKVGSKYKIGFDVLSASTTDINKREDYFYKVDILAKGKVLYERKSS